MFDLQWALRRIAAPAAWTTTTGTPEVTIAIADSGVASEQPDLAPNLVAGWDYIDGDATPEDETPGWHGTEVAAIAAARGDDGAGAAGVTWTSRIMPLRVLDADGKGSVSDAIEAYGRARREGARSSISRTPAATSRAPSATRWRRRVSAVRGRGRQ